MKTKMTIMLLDNRAFFNTLMKDRELTEIPATAVCIELTKKQAKKLLNVIQPNDFFVGEILIESED